MTHDVSELRWILRYWADLEGQYASEVMYLEEKLETAKTALYGVRKEIRRLKSVAGVTEMEKDRS